MNVSYLLAELARRRGRTLAAVISVALGVAVFVSLQAYAEAYRSAARAPLVEMGADLTAQRQGTVPEKFEGVLFPHSGAPIHRNEIEQISRLPGVQDVAETVFFWAFEPAGFVAGLGLDPSDNFGPGRLKATLTTGRFLRPGEHNVAVADVTYAQQAGLKPGSVVNLDGQPFSIVGLVDSTRAGELANANVYLPLADAQALAFAAPQVQSVYDIKPDDANMLFIKADQTRAEEIGAQVKQILGDKAIVSTARSFAAELGVLFALIDRFGFIVGVVAFVFAALLLMRVMAAGLWERRRDVALMRAVGWRQREIVRQLWSEALVQAVVGGLLGLVLAALATWAMSRATVSVPVPWELSPTPHFLPGGAKVVAVVVSLPAGLTLALVAWALGLSVAGATLVGVWMPTQIAGIKPAEVFRSE